MKLLIIIDDLRSGGTENVLANRIAELPPDIELHILSLFALGPIAERINSLGHKIQFLDMKNFGLFKTFSKVREILEKESFDIAVCMRDVSKALFPRFLKKHIPVVVMLWDSPIIKRSFKQSWAEWFQVKFSHSVPYCSSFNAAIAVKKVYGLENITVIPNCYDRKEFNKRNTKINKREDIFQIISVGGVRKEKNYRDKLEIAKKLKDKGIKFKLSLIGYDPDGLIPRDILKNRLEDEVVSLGVRKDVKELLEKADLFLFTSSSEGFPVALIEAMTVGLPCVSYEFPSLKEIDEDFSRIEVVSQGNIDAAVQKIIYLSKHPEEAESLGTKASQHVSAKFASDINAKQWIEFLVAI